jgi:hypothetical protein
MLARIVLVTTVAAAHGWSLRAPDVPCTRRSCLTAAGLSLLPLAACAGEPEPMVMLTDEEMAARVARKQELLRAQSAKKAKDAQFLFNGDYQRGVRSNQQMLDGSIRSDVNPEAGEALRSRSFLENARATLAKQDELKNRDKLQKREDLCGEPPVTPNVRPVHRAHWPQPFARLNTRLPAPFLRRNAWARLLRQRQGTKMNTFARESSVLRPAPRVRQVRQVPAQKMQEI